jgi:glycyl-tRNA synthetase beta chain
VVARFKGYAVETGVKPEWFEAVRVVASAQPLDMWRRLQAVERFVQLPEAEALAAANKRIGNILKKSAVCHASVNTELLQVGAEQQLWLALCDIEVSAQAAFSQGNYAQVLQTLSALREPADAFFADVMVNVEDEALRNNRLALLVGAHQLMSLVADIGQL